MLASLLLLASFTQPREVTLEPTDDVWVYQFAEDQANDPFLRVWGDEQGAVGKSFEGHLTFSYSCLKFEIPAGTTGPLTGAKLVLTHAPEPGWDSKDAEKNPLEARSLTTEWEEENWTYEQAAKIHPSADANTIYGSGWSPAPSTDQTFKIEIDLLKGKGGFSASFEKAASSPSRLIGIALTSTLSPQEAGENGIYKLYSKSNEPALRPKLVLTFGS
ncbi:MAG: hypothetical protein JSS66_10500 [Armatimonadetes bacterium]|nr:hypothetical protein [Armatimonadota bacterium]